jgi:V8-like Glu-specific endopeptidase
MNRIKKPIILAIFAIAFAPDNCPAQFNLKRATDEVKKAAEISRASLDLDFTKSSQQFQMEAEKAYKEAVIRIENVIGNAPADERVALRNQVSPGVDTLLKATSLSVDPGSPVTGIEKGVVSLSFQSWESVITGDDRLPGWFLEEGARRLKTVGRIATNNHTPVGLATGFLISQNYLMTNHHVIQTKESAKRFMVQMGYQLNPTADGFAGVIKLEFDAESSGGFYTNSNPLMDYSIVKVKLPASAAPVNAPPLPPGDQFGFVSLESNVLYSNDQLVNIIQHPKGRPREIAIHGNKLISIHEQVIRYTTDTDRGSSGSPIFNNSWMLIGLHHAGDVDFNQGVRMDKIIDDIRQNAPPEIKAELGL